MARASHQSRNQHLDSSGVQKQGALLQPQCRLTVTHPSDESEREADCVAEQVTWMAEPADQKEILRPPLTPLIQRNGNAESAGPESAPSIVHDALASPGQPLNTATREYFEARFGHDFGHVRIHTDENAGESAASVNAAAYAIGSDIVFAHGVYQPGRSPGRMLIAHELAHVVQMSKGSLRGVTTLYRRKNEAASDEGSLPSQVNFIVSQLGALQKKSAWTGIDRQYRALESLGDEAFNLLSASRPTAEVAAVHDLGAQAAHVLGDMQAYWSRRERQMKVLVADVGHIDDAALKPVVESLTFVEERFGAVKITPRSVPKSEKKRERMRGPELVPVKEPEGFDPIIRRSFEFAAEKIALTGEFTGLIPAGEYRLGDQVFTVNAGTKTTDAKVLTVLWAE